MSHTMKAASTVAGLVAMTRDDGISEIIVESTLEDVPTFRLRPGQCLRGLTADAELKFAPGSDGIQLSTDNRVADLRLVASVAQRVIFNDAGVETLGVLELRNLTATGCVQILARDRVRQGHVEIDGLHIIAADARGGADKPHDYGVSVLQGAFTLWNMQSDETVDITANLIALSAGSLNNPVLGSGIIVSGATNRGGRLTIQRLQTGAVYSNGKIPPGTADTISGGVFTVYGTEVDLVENVGPVTTFGPNDMALDNWGDVDRWQARGKITTHGPSGIGFVNFGRLGDLRIDAPIETFGQGSRGFNVYAGSVDQAFFDRIVTRGDGAVGVQIARPMGTLKVARGIETRGGTGPSLVKGVVQTLSAIALSIKPGGSVRRVDITGGVKTHGTGVPAIELLGVIESMRIEDGICVFLPSTLDHQG